MSGFVQVNEHAYVYVLVRKDLSGPQVAVQAAHAAIEVARSSLIPPDLDHPSVVLCGIDNESKLQKELERYQSMGIICKPFYEADLGGQLTAFATEPVFGEKRRLFKRLQLFKQPVLQGGAA